MLQRPDLCSCLITPTVSWDGVKESNHSNETCK